MPDRQPQTDIGAYLDEVCPYYLHYGMTYDEFWHGPISALPMYRQKYQFDIEARNQELWLQGVYIRAAIVSSFDKQSKYPDSPRRITEMTALEQEAENRRRIETWRERLNELKRMSDARREARV